MSSRFRILLVFLLLASLQGACQRLDNSISEFVLDCGSDVASQQSYVKILDPAGKELNSSQLLAWQIHGDGSRSIQPLSSKGCIGTDRASDGPYVVTTRFSDRTWGTVVRKNNIPLLRSIRLADRNAIDLTAKCTSPIYTKGLIKDPLVWPTDAVDAFPAEISFNQAGHSHPSTQIFLRGDGDIALPNGLQDGPFELRVSYDNLFKSNDLELLQRDLSCSYVLDRQAPELRNSFSATLETGLFKVEPGENLTLKVEDGNALGIRYCLHLADDEQTCSDIQSFASLPAEGAIQAPESGRWCLEAIAEDRAGNRSDQKRDCFIAYQTSKIESIRALSDNAFSLVGEDQLAAAVKIVKALAFYFSLETEEERSAVRTGLFNSTMTVASRVFERSRYLSEDLVRALEPIDESGHFLEANNSALRIWDGEGRQYASQPFSYGYRVEVKNRVALVASPQELGLFDLHDLTFRALSFEALPQKFRILAVRWNPLADEFLVYGQDPEDEYPKVLIFARAGDGYRINQTLGIDSDIEAEELNWSPDGHYLALASADALIVVERSTAGVYAAVNQGLFEGINRGMVFLQGKAEAQLLFMRDSGALSTWTATTGFQTVENDDQVAGNAPPSIADPSSGRLRTLLKKDTGSAFVLRGSLLQLATVTNDRVEINPAPLSGHADPKSILNWKVSSDGQILSINLLAPGSESQSLLISGPAESNASDWSRQQIIMSGLDPFEEILLLPGMDITVASDRARHIHFWKRTALNPSFPVSFTSTPLLKWFQVDGRDELVTAGYDGFARLWTLNGTKTGEFRHIEAGKRLAQINDVVWNGAKDRFATVAEDGRTLVWDPNGKLLAILDDDPGEDPNGIGTAAFWRGAAVFAKDQTTIVTGGDKTFAIWKKDAKSENYSLAANIFQGFSSSHAKPGDLRIFDLKGQETILASRPEAGRTPFGFFTLDGKAVVDAFESPVGKVRRLALNENASHLALVEEGNLKVYRASEKGFVLEAETSEGLSNRTLLQLQWSPDGREILAVFGQDKIAAWVFEGSRLHFKAERKILSGSDPGAIRWFADSQRLSFAERTSVIILNAALEEKSRIQPFEDKESAIYLAPSPDGRYIAAAQNGQIKMIDLMIDESTLQRRCQDLKNFLEVSNEFDRSQYLTPADRTVCLGLP